MINMPTNIVVINRWPWHNLMYRHGYETRQVNLGGFGWPHNLPSTADDYLARDGRCRDSEWVLTEHAISATLLDNNAPRCDSCGQVKR